MDKPLTQFNNKKILSEAFTHRSYLNETREKLSSNERLEFLGDAVLELLVTHFLFETFPKSEEGALTNLRSSIVRTEALARAAANLNFDKMLRLSKGEEKGGGRNNQSILANVFEAYLGALYLDQGLKAAKNFIHKYLFIYLPKIIKNRSYVDEKSYLQEKIQEKEKISPLYKVLSETGPDHKKTFSVGVYVKKTMIGKGEGKSKQEAEEKAARFALESLGWL